MSAVTDLHFAFTFPIFEPEHKELFTQLNAQGAIIDIQVNEHTDYIVTEHYGEPNFSLNLTKSRRFKTPVIPKDDLEDMLDKPETYFRISNNVFVLTGNMWELRSHITTRILAQGGIVHPRVTSETDFLIVGTKSLGTNKYKQAIQKNISVIEHLLFKDNLEIIEMASHPYDRDVLLLNDIHLASLRVEKGDLVVIRNRGAFKIIDKQLYDFNGRAFGIVRDFTSDSKVQINLLGVIHIPDEVRVTNLAPEKKEDKPKRKLTKETKAKITNTLDKTKNEFDEFDKLFK